ncbi:sec-independent protein translocase protein TATB, chloroplastic, partial [Tanacetum coccineum]
MAYSTLIHPYSSPLPKLYKIQTLKSVPQLGLSSFSSWNGLKSNGFSVSLISFKFEKKRKSGRKGVFASLFGVGAPEALVIGVVALLVFGPKGLAE